MAIPDYQPNSEVSEQLLAELMATGRGSFIRQAEEIVENKIEELDQQEEEENRILRRKACMKFPSVKILTCGCRKNVTNLCGDYRKCDNCREKYFREKIQPRVSYAHNHLPLGEWTKFVKVHDNDYGAYTKAIDRYGGKYINFPQSNNMNLIIHNAEGFGDPSLYDFDEYNTGEDINFEEVLANVPENRRISGKLGIKALVEDEEEEGEEEEPDTFTVVREPFLYSPSATERQLNLAYMKAVEKTQNISVSDPHEFCQAAFARLEEMKKLLPEDTIIYYEIRSIGQKQSELWNKNPNNGVVQIVGIEELHTAYSDKDISPGLAAFLAEAEKPEPRRVRAVV